METVTVTIEGDRQTVRLPKSVHLPPTVFVRQEGDAVVLEPAKPRAWPAAFCDSIHVSYPAFARPAQGQLSLVRSLQAAMTHLLDTDACSGPEPGSSCGPLPAETPRNGERLTF